MSQPVPPQSGGNGRISPLGWAWRGLVLVGVSVLSGVIWFFAISGTSDDPDDAQAGDTVPNTKYDFTSVASQDQQAKCVETSTGKIREFFAEHGCEHLRRALYTSTLPDGQKTLTSLITVRMSDAPTAKALNRLVTQDQTGNVQDLVSDGSAGDDYPSLEHDLGYASEAQGELVVIGESVYYSKPDTYEDKRLTVVTQDALKLAKKQDSNTG